MSSLDKERFNHPFSIVAIKNCRSNRRGTAVNRSRMDGYRTEILGQSNLIDPSQTLRGDTDRLYPSPTNITKAFPFYICVKYRITKMHDTYRVITMIQPKSMS